MKKVVGGILTVFVLLSATFLALAKPACGAVNAGNSWVTKAPMGWARAYLGVAVINGKIYAIGGDRGHLMDNIGNPLS